MMVIAGLTVWYLAITTTKPDESPGLLGGFAPWR